MIVPHIEKGVKGHAAPIVVVSEGSHVDRAMFNCITHILFDRPCESTAEIDEVWEIQCSCEDQIIALLGNMPKREYRTHPQRYELTKIGA